MKAIDILKPFNPCYDMVEWLGDKTLDAAWNTCPRGDWMLWIYSRIHPENVKGLVAAAAECAATVKHLMTDPRSIAAVEAAQAFGRGEIDETALRKAEAAAWAAWAARATRAATWADWAAAWAAESQTATWAAESQAAESDSAKLENQLETADICRRMLKL